LGAALQPKVTRASIANIEAGKQRVLTHTLVQLADALGIDVVQIIPKRESVRRAMAPSRLEAQLAEHNVPSKIIKQLSAQLKRSQSEK
jgi:transcriptional regulator with XRE-family HTH domain